MGQASRKSKAEDLLRNSRRCLARSIREVERESSCLDIEEQRLRAELKKTAEKGDLNSAKILAEDVARIRQTQAKLCEMRSHLRTMSLRLQSLKSSRTLATSLEDVTQTIVKLNVELNLPGFQQLMECFLQDSDKLQDFDTVMNEGLEDFKKKKTLEVSDTLEAEKVYHQVLEEIGLDTTAELNYTAAKVSQPPISAINEKEKILVPSNFVEEKSKAEGVSSAQVLCAYEKSLEDRLRLLNIF